MNDKPDLIRHEIRELAERMQAAKREVVNALGTTCAEFFADVTKTINGAFRSDDDEE